MPTSSKVVAIIGAGPTGLHAAVKFVQLGCRVVVVEQAKSVAAHVAKWAHVRMFSPWKYNVDAALVAELEQAGLYDSNEPSPPTARPEECPTGAEYIAQYLAKIAAWLDRSDAAELLCGTAVAAVTRSRVVKKDDLSGKARQALPFVLRMRAPAGGERFLHADYVVDASGPGGGAALGEAELPPERVDYHVPDVLGEHGAGEGWAGGHHLVVGAGFSAVTTVKNLLDLRRRAPATCVTWLTRAAASPYTVLEQDILPQRKELCEFGNAITTAGAEGVTHLSKCHIESMRCVPADGGTKVQVELQPDADGGAPHTLLVDRVVSNVGYRPDSALYSELHVHQCWATDGPIKLAASLIAAAGGGGDCLAQTAPGPELLITEEPGFFILGMKSYGRSSMFIIKIGLEQVGQVATLVAAEIRATA